MMRKGLRRRDVLRLRNVYADLYKKGVGSILLLDVIFDLDNIGCDSEKEKGLLVRSHKISVPSKAQVPKKELLKTTNDDKISSFGCGSLKEKEGANTSSVPSKAQEHIGCEKERRESHTGKWRGVNREIPRMPEKSIPASPSQEPKQESILAEAVEVYEQAIEEAKMVYLLRKCRKKNEDKMPFKGLRRVCIRCGKATYINFEGFIKHVYRTKECKFILHENEVKDRREV